jgi:hypothetical protein
VIANIIAPANNNHFSVSLPRFGQAGKSAMAKTVTAHNAVSGIGVKSRAI